MNEIDLTKKLVSIKSEVSKDCDESEVAEFLFNFIKREFPGLQLRKQYIDSSKKRFNVIAKGSNNPQLFINGHMDVVQAQDGWKTNPYQPVVRNGRIYGRGTNDMKGAIAAFLAALINIKKRVDFSKLMMLWYCDEEYDFKGMKKFVSSFPKIDPQLTISLDGNLALASGCRGVIEISLLVKGRSYHSARPFKGLNVITNAVTMYKIFSSNLGKYDDQYLGPTTCNLAYIRGGCVQSAKNKNSQTGLEPENFWQSEGNVIPDTAEMVIEVRPSVNKLNKDLVIAKVKSISRELGLRIESITVRHNLAPWPVDYTNQEIKSIQEAYQKVGLPFNLGSRQFSGYIDTAMMANKLKGLIFILGTSGENSHGNDENIKVKDLRDLTKLLQEIICKYCR